MNLYLLSQDINNDYDTFDSVVVAAKSEDEARNINPSCNGWGKQMLYTGWCARPDQVEVKLIGKAVKGTEAGVILASFNAG